VTLQRKRLTNLLEKKMCRQVVNKMRSEFRKHRASGLVKNRVVFIIFFLYIFSFAGSAIFAQEKSEEYGEVKNWQEPRDAIPFKELVLKDEIYFYKHKPFTGVAIERYPNGVLQRAVTFAQGKQNGQMLMWYPDGSPQMSAYYVNGYLQGRFLGWYLNGSVIYDLMINKGTYASDNLLDEDETRASSEVEQGEREGPDNDQSKE